MENNTRLITITIAIIFVVSTHKWQTLHTLKTFRATKQQKVYHWSAQVRKEEATHTQFCDFIQLIRICVASEEKSILNISLQLWKLHLVYGRQWNYSEAFSCAPDKTVKLKWPNFVCCLFLVLRWLFLCGFVSLSHSPIGSNQKKWYFVFINKWIKCRDAVACQFLFLFHSVSVALNGIQFAFWLIIGFNMCGWTVSENVN